MAFWEDKSFFKRIINSPVVTNILKKEMNKCYKELIENKLALKFIENVCKSTRKPT